MSLKIDEMGNVIVGGVRRNTNLVTENYTYQTYITSLDSLGNENWTYLSDPADGLRGAANDMVLLDDGSLVVASGVGHEIDIPSVNAVYFDKYIFKLNPQHEIEWELTFTDPLLSSSGRTTNIEQMSDGSGFIMAGVASMDLPPPALGANMGWLAKISNEGDSLWTRKYLYLTETPSHNVIYDLKEAPDGGFIACGEARDIGTDATYPQQAWLLKLDEHGCLVPGCHLPNNTEEGGQPEVQLAIYPNPTADYLNFQLWGKNVGQSASFRIIDAQGKTVREHEAGQAGDTYIVPVWEWAAGVYFLQYVEEGEVLCSEKFIKQ